MKSHTCLLVLLITLSTVSSFRIFPVAAKAPFFVVASEDVDNEEFGASDSSIAETSTSLSEESSATEASTDFVEESSTPTVTSTNAAEATVTDEIFTNPPVSLIDDSTKSVEIIQEISTKESTTVAIETTTEEHEVTTDAPEIVTKAIVITTAVPDSVTNESQTTASPTTATSQTTIASTTKVSSEEVSTTSQSEPITLQPVPELDISTNLLPPKTEFRKFDFDPRYDDWKKVPVSYEEILIPRS